jgi:hypothetical protein
MFQPSGSMGVNSARPVGWIDVVNSARPVGWIDGVASAWPVGWIEACLRGGRLGGVEGLLQGGQGEVGFAVAPNHWRFDFEHVVIGAVGTEE